MRFAGFMAVAIPLCAACALTVSYDGFEKSSSSSDASAGQGGSTGIGGGNFGGAGGSAGVDGSVGGASGGAGGSGGIADGSTCGGDPECPVDEPCVDWSCSSGKCTANPLSGVGCAPTVCGDTTKAVHSMCVSGVCTQMNELCSPYTCQNNACLMSCANSLDCVPGLVCNFTSCQQCQHCSEKYDNPGSSLAFCEPNSQALWDALTQCCNEHCSNECGAAGVCDNGLGLPQSACGVCLSDGQNCNDSWSACLSDT